MENDRAALHAAALACPLFADITGDELDRMLTCLDARAERFDRHATILGEGEPAGRMGILLSGAAHIERVDYVGNRSILSRIAPGEVFAEAFACANVSTMPVSVMAETDCIALLLDGRHVMQTCSRHCAHHRRLIFNLMRSLADKALDFHRKLEVISHRSTRDKLMAYLSLEAQRAGSRSFTIPFDRQALADYLEVDRSGLSVEISRLRREGVLESERNQFTLL